MNPDFLVYFTTAPVAYDGFGTRRTGVSYELAGKRWYEVEIETEVLDWQTTRYASGLMGSIAQDEFRKMIREASK